MVWNSWWRYDVWKKANIWTGKGHVLGQNGFSSSMPCASRMPKTRSRGRRSSEVICSESISEVNIQGSGGWRRQKGLIATGAFDCLQRWIAEELLRVMVRRTRSRYIAWLIKTKVKDKDKRRQPSVRKRFFVVVFWYSFLEFLSTMTFTGSNDVIRHHHSAQDAHQSDQRHCEWMHELHIHMPFVWFVGSWSHKQCVIFF